MDVLADVIKSSIKNHSYLSTVFGCKLVHVFDGFLLSKVV